MASDWAELKTSLRVVGVERVDEFAAVCAALGCRPHQLVERLVAEGIAGYRRSDSRLDEFVRLVSKGRQERRAELGVAEDNDDGGGSDTVARRRHLKAVR